MAMAIRTVGIILKKGSDEPRRIGEELAAWFAARSVAVVFDAVEAGMDLLVILGGDGTLLHVAAQASARGIPVVGVNLGGLGFLTEIAVDERYAVFEQILAGEMTVEERMMLKVRLVSSAGVGEWRYALNDVVISKGNVDQLVELSAWADAEYITTYRADGLIVSTPTGSTAYNLSAGGPIVQPRLHAMLVTPICPFMLESRPILLPPVARLRTQLADGRNQATGRDVKVIVDGQFAWEMHAGDTLEVEAAEKPLRLISSPRKGYFEILRGKLNWGGTRPGS
ncbi:MAG: NAD(+)/NADH kinase [Thermodesulfobacteriota bacterium]